MRNDDDDFPSIFYLSFIFPSPRTRPFSFHFLFFVDDDDDDDDTDDDDDDRVPEAPDRGNGVAFRGIHTYIHTHIHTCPAS